MYYLDEQYPIPDTEGRKLTPYQFTITNTCEQFISYNVNLKSLEATTMDSSAVKVMINNEAPVNLSILESTSVSIDTSKDSKILATGSLGSNDSVDYALRLWMDYGTTADTSSMNNVFESKIVVTATIGTYKPSDYVTTLHDALLINEYAVTDVNNAISKIESKTTPDFNNPAPISEYRINESSNISSINFKLPTSKIIGSANAPSVNETNILPLVGTADELMFSGLIKNTTMNKLAYTYSNEIYWTMSPLKFSNSSTDAHIFPKIEGFIHDWGKVNTGYALRPVINLKADVEITGGIGTINDPYVIKTT